ncbi:MAG: CoA-binding protein [Candidatus Micrarchaeota archaeon]|nr:CoA-binding protein [Candidatus Micrarchaeota archaeon]
MAKMDLEPMMKPKSVAIIGASRDPDKVGHVILQNYVNAGYQGKIFVVNKNADSIMGFKSYASILDIKEKVDLAVIAIPAPFVPEALEECGKAKARTALVISGGFAEVGNKELQEQLVAVAKKYGIPTMGPNCLGIMDPRSRSDTLFLPTYKLARPQIGGVSFVSQSGAVGSAILDMISAEGFGLSKFISYGNAAHIDEVDILEYLMGDDSTKVIVMYLEGIKRGREFFRIAKDAGKKKPIIVLKAGRTNAGMQAAHSHTASLAGSYETNIAAFLQSGFTVADDLNDLLYYAKVFESEPEPKGNRIAVITNGGGIGVITTDEIAASGNLKMAEFSKQTVDALKKTMPVLVNARNPLDLAGDADGKRYEDAISAVMQDPNVDMMVVVTLFQTPGADSSVASKLIHYKERSDKPMIGIAMGSEYTQIHKLMMESSGFPVYDSPAAAVKSLSALLKYKEYKQSH